MKLVIFFIGLFLPYLISIPNGKNTKNPKNPKDTPGSTPKPEASKPEASETSSTESTQLAALGRVADLGDLYDARTDNFLEISIYNSSGATVYKTETPYSTVEYINTETLSEKMKKLDISASLKISVLSGLFEIQGSGQYIHDDKKSSKSAKASLIYKTRTAQEHLSIFSTKSTNFLDTALLEKIDATHVVIGIEWGADVVLSIEETSTQSSNREIINAKLSAELKAVVIRISGSGSVEFDHTGLESSKTFHLHLNGDIIPNMVPQTIKESIAFIRDIPKLLKDNNNGKGKIIKYILMPLAAVRKFTAELSKITTIVQDINDDLTDQFMVIFQEMKDSKLLINDAYNDMTKWILMIPEEDVQNVSQLRSQFDTYTNNVKVNFSALVVNFRSGASNADELKTIITEYQNSRYTLPCIENLLKTYTPTMHKIILLNLLESLNAMFLDRRTNENIILAKNFLNEVRIISLNLEMEISSFYVREIVRLLQVEMAKKSGAITYYIKDDPTLSFPNVNIYIEGGLKKSFPVGKTEYIILISESGKVVIMNANSYNLVTTFEDKKLSQKSFAIIDDTLYAINLNSGLIETTDIKNIIAKPENGISMTRVGSFPKGTGYVQSVAAVIGPILYFITYDGLLYKYDTKLKTVNKCGKLEPANPTNYQSLIVVKGILYIYRNTTFYSFDGTSLSVVNSTDVKMHSALFELVGKVCRVGGDINDQTQHTVHCYDPEVKEWGNVHSYTNEVRRYPGVVKTSSGTIIFGGKSVDSNGKETEKIKSAEFFNVDTKIWSYIPIFSEMIADIYLVYSVFF